MCHAVTFAAISGVDPGRVKQRAQLRNVFLAKLLRHS
jgi:hypothetical protein